MKYRIISKNRVLFTVTLILAFILGTLASQKTINRHIVQKNKDIVSSLSLINNKISNLPSLNTFDIEASGNGTYIVNTYVSACEDIKHIKKTIKPTILDIVFGKNKLKIYKKNIDLFKEVNQNQLQEFCTLSSNLKSAKKFLEYNPMENILNLDNDSEKISQHIGNTREGLANIAKIFENSYSEPKVINEIYKVQSAVEIFDKDRDLDQFSVVTSSAQKEILQIFQNHYTLLVDSYNSTYNKALLNIVGD